MVRLKAIASASVFTCAPGGKSARYFGRSAFDSYRRIRLSASK